MKNQIEQYIQDLTMRRERIKKELFAKMAERTRRLELFIVHGESTSRADRLTLDAEIAALEADRQSTKLDLIRAKYEARNFRGHSLAEHLMQALKDHGLHHEIEMARKRATKDLEESGMALAYKVQLSV